MKRWLAPLLAATLLAGALASGTRAFAANHEPQIAPATHAPSPCEPSSPERGHALSGAFLLQRGSVRFTVAPVVSVLISPTCGIGPGELHAPALKRPPISSLFHS